MNDNLLQHFRADEKLVVQRLLGYLEQVDRNYAPYLTNFLNPRERYILETLARNQNIQSFFEGGFDNFEQGRVLIAPDYYCLDNNDFEIIYFELQYASQFNQLKHNQILGSLLGQGIKREQLGDIVQNEKRFQIAVSQSIASYLEMNLQKIGKVPVKLIRISKSQLIQNQQNIFYKRLTITSLRLDNIIANVYNISRQTTKKMIENGLCKVNFGVIANPNTILSISDVVSVRKYGRFYVEEFQGKTKKDRYAIKIKILK